MNKDIKNMKHKKVAIFDFDGVVMDTETVYTEFWDVKGEELLDRKDFGSEVKGQSLNLIYDTYFPDRKDLQKQLDKEVVDMDSNMDYQYIPGAKECMKALREAGVVIGVVTGSCNRKMSYVDEQHPDFKDLADVIITSDHVTHAKPHPEGFLLAMEKLDAKPEQVVVFEDSIYGLEAAREAGATVVGLVTTNELELVKPLSDYVIKDFIDIDYKAFCEFFAK